MADEKFLKLKALDVPANQVAGVCLASAAGHWAQVASDLPADAEFAGAWFDAAAQALRLFFFHESFPAVDSADKVPVLPPPEVRAAERDGGAG